MYNAVLGSVHNSFNFNRKENILKDGKILLIDLFYFIVHIYLKIFNAEL